MQDNNDDVAKNFRDITPSDIEKLLPKSSELTSLDSQSSLSSPEQHDLERMQEQLQTLLDRAVSLYSLHATSVEHRRRSRLRRRGRTSFSNQDDITASSDDYGRDDDYETEQKIDDLVDAIASALHHTFDLGRIVSSVSPSLFATSSDESVINRLDDAVMRAVNLPMDEQREKEEKERLMGE
eukprot:5005100-Ditylum_brightwellii.AAC.1